MHAARLDLSGWRIEEQPFAAGSEGAVHAAESPDGVKAIVKTARQSPDALLAEAEKLAELNAAGARWLGRGYAGGKNIPTLIGVEQSSRGTRLAVERGGPSLRARMNRGERLTAREGAEVLLGGARALRIAHTGDARLPPQLHADIFPDQILFDGSRTHLIDWSHSLPLRGSTWEGNYWWGYGPFLSPEAMVEGTARLDATSDLYSLAATVASAIAGRPVFEANARWWPEREPWREAHRRGPNLDGIDDFGLRRRLLKALSHEPKDRYPSAHAFIDAIRDLAILGKWRDPIDRIRIGERLSEGCSSVAYRVSRLPPGMEHLTILKLVKAFAPSVRRTKDADEETRARIAGLNADVARRLRSDPALSRVVPETVVIGPGEMLQAEAPGVPFARLSTPAQREAAKRDVERIVGLARRTVSDVPLSAALQNFHFDPNSGAVTGWFDFLSDSRILA